MLTKKQKKVLDYTREYTENKGYAPSLDEIRKHFRLASVSTAHYHINKLQKEGYLKKENHRPRAISVQPSHLSQPPTLKKLNFESALIRILGSANCGPAEIIAEENIEGYLKVPQSLLPKKDGIFAIRAKGDSMDKANIKGKNIKDGDLVLIDGDYRTPIDGDYVVSIIDGCANIKKFKIDRKTKQKMLISESKNPKHKPIFLHPSDEFMINGKILSVAKT